MQTKRALRFATLLSTILFALTAGVRVADTAAQSSSAAQADAGTWFCPMHPDVTADTPGKCRKCEMTLVQGNPFDTRDFELDVTTVPAALRPGEPFRMTMNIRYPQTGAIVMNFEEVHEKRYHLFVISEDMTSFQHIHPVQQPDGSWSLDVTVPRAGYYRVLSDFLPAGAAPQFLSKSIITADFDGDAESQLPRLVPDDVLSRTVDGMTAEVTLPQPLVAGEWGHMRFTLKDSATGQPVTDLQPYLGAFGHMLMMSEDMADYVHAHPVASPETDVARGVAGPEVAFEGYMPRAGLYRAWTQFQRAGRLVTVPFTFRVMTLEESVRPAPAR
jgi:hypothetical protein